MSEFRQLPAAGVRGIRRVTIPCKFPVAILCVPNFSEGTRVPVLESIEAAIRSVAGTLLLGHEFERDHNRAVFTFAGPTEAVLESAVRAACLAARDIDLRTHHGVHPRIGAADVIPFIPLEDSSIEDCVPIAVRAAESIWARARVPSFLYEFAARIPERRNLEYIRKRGFEELLAKSQFETDLRPDVGGPGLHPTAGACAIGARRTLVAVNINLASSDVSVADRIAKTIRASSGGMPYVKALGLMLRSTGTAQVSMNLTNYEVTGLAAVYERVKQLAASSGVGIASTEVIGFPPRAAIEGAGEFLALCSHWNPGRILENAIAACSASQAK